MTQFARSAILDWNGDVQHGTGSVTAGSTAYSIPVTFPHLSGEPSRMTTPEELLAASHAACFGIGLRSVIKRYGGAALRVRVTATVTANKGAHGIRLQSSHLHGEIEGLSGIEPGMLRALGNETEEGCTISAAIRGSVAIAVELCAV